jgi:hypothetical protein
VEGIDTRAIVSDRDPNPGSTGASQFATPIDMQPEPGGTRIDGVPHEIVYHLLQL